MTTPHASASPLPAADLAPLLAELRDLTDRAAVLSARLAHAEAGAGPRPGWPIRRLPAKPNAAPRAGGGV
ncbi:MAG: hypothetical protein ACK4S2_13585 [Gemmobacter sp.]|uniref:hypothetical protein n=1 Tax=Gemmobacter sp. TaxID=1898957 RepID=UPI00391954F8